MTRINLSDGYYIENKNGDLKLCMTYMTKISKKNPKSNERTKTVGYFRKLDQCIERYLIEVHGSQDVECSIREYVELVDKCNTHCIEAICNLIKDGGLVC